MPAMDRDTILKQAEKLVRQGRLEPAIAEYQRLRQQDPTDWAVVQTLADLHARAGDAEAAVREFIRLADHLRQEGFLPRAAALYKRVLRLDAGHQQARLRLAEIAERQGLLGDARTHLAAVAEARLAAGDAAGAAEVTVRLARLESGEGEGPSALARVTDPRLLLAVTRMEFERGMTARGRAAVVRLLSQAPASRVEVVALARELASRGLPEAAAACADPLVELALRDHAWGDAAEALEACTGAPGADLELLMRLVDVCVDGELADRLPQAQVRLAEAYLGAGRIAEARAVAEDLVVREPNEGHREWFCRVLTAMGVPDPAGALAAVLGAEDEPDEDAPWLTIETAVVADAVGDVVADTVDDAADDAMADSQADSVTDVEVLVEAADEDDVSTGTGVEAGPVAGPVAEVDLTAMLTELSAPVSAGEAKPPMAQAPDLDTVFARLRQAAEATASARSEYEAGLAHLAAGRFEEAVPALEAAARVPPLRFEAASRLGAYCVAQGDLARGIEWLERAAEAPAPDLPSGRRLLVALADALEQSGEAARALAVLMEAAADAPDDRVLAGRIARLTQPEAEG